MLDFLYFLQNHSCDPNCHIEKWHVDGEFCIGLFALKDIAAGEELTYDYNFQTFGDVRQECLCGADRCRGWITSKNSEPRERVQPKMKSNKMKGKHHRHSTRDSSHMTVRQKRENFDVKFVAKNRLFIIYSRLFLRRNFNWIIKQNETVISIHSI